MKKAEILAIATWLFPDWRVDIQEKFVLLLSAAILKAQAEALKAQAESSTDALETLQLARERHAEAQAVYFALRKRKADRNETEYDAARTEFLSSKNNLVVLRRKYKV